jgi:hypothetical protein
VTRAKMNRKRLCTYIHMKPIHEIIREKNIQLDTLDPVALHGFTQVPNFFLRDPKISVGAKVAFAMFLSYAWHNDSCFPGQDRLADDMGLSRVRVTQLIAELQRGGLFSITRRGQGKTNLYTLHFQVPKERKRPEVNRFTSGSKPAYDLR